MNTMVSVAAVRLLGKALDELFKNAAGKMQAAGVRWKNEASKRRLAGKITAAQRVKTFWQRDKSVDLTSFYYPGKVDFGGTRRKRVESIKDLTLHENIVLQGIVGQGKSTFLRYLCIQELSNKGSGRIPVFVELRAVTNEGLRPLIYSALDRLGFQIDDDIFDFYAKSGQLLLLLDAFDEVGADMVAATIYTLEEIAEKYERCQMVITSRPNSDIQQSRHFRVVRLAPMRQEDHEPFLTRIGMDREDTNRLIKAIRLSPADVTSLLSTPLIMTLLATLYQSDKLIPQDVPEFYERLFHTLFTKHDATKPGLARHVKSRLTELRLRQLFEGFCFSILQRGASPLLTPSAFNEFSAAASKISNIPCDPNAFQHDITKIACLMQLEGDKLHFIHRSVLEYHAAAFIRSLSDTVAPKVYGQLVTLQKHAPWRQVMQFLNQIDVYRFAKHFGIPSIDFFFHWLGINADCPNSYSAELVMEKLFNGGILRISAAADPSKSQSQFGPILQVRYGTEIALSLSGLLFECFARRSASGQFQHPTSITNVPEELVNIEMPWSDVLDEPARHSAASTISTEIQRLVELRKSYENRLQADNDRLDLITLV